MELRSLLREGFLIFNFVFLTIALLGCHGTPFQAEEKPPVNITEHYKTLYSEYEDRIAEIQTRDQMFLYLSYQVSLFEKTTQEFQALTVQVESLLASKDCKKMKNLITLDLLMVKDNLERLSKDLVQATLMENLQKLSVETKAYTPSNQTKMEEAYSEMQERLRPGFGGVLSLVESSYLNTYTQYINTCEGQTNETTKQ